MMPKNLETETLDAHTKASLVYQTKMRNEGRCPVCGEQTDGSFYCETHAKARNDARKKRESIKKVEGMCYRNCPNKAVTGTHFCEKHLKIRRKYQKAQQAASRARRS